MTKSTYRPVVGVHNAAKGVPHRHGTYDNVFSGLHCPQAWFPIAGYDLRAPVSWSVMPGR